MLFRNQSGYSDCTGLLLCECPSAFAEHDNWYSGEQVVDQTCSVQAVHYWHGKVHANQLGRVILELFAQPLFRPARLRKP